MSRPQVCEGCEARRPCVGRADISCNDLASEYENGRNDALKAIAFMFERGIKLVGLAEKDGKWCVLYELPL